MKNQLPTSKELAEMLPHGSGIDCKWQIDETRDGMVDAHNSFHLMNENGMYDGWANFTVRFFRYRADVLNPLKGPCEGKTQIVQRKGDLDFKVICRGSAWRRNCAYGLKGDLEEQIAFALESILPGIGHETIVTS